MPAIAGIQILLAGVILILTTLLVFVGVQVIFILRDVRLSIKKINQVASPQMSVRTLLEYLLVGKAKKSPADYLVINEEETEEIVQMTNKSDAFSHITQLQERGRRVFHREGKPLA